MATRWSAPESHQRCCFSPASDMWMVGHMMYEILTHGRLPYSDVPRTDEDLMPMVVQGEKRLCNDRCIPRSIHQLIQRLCSVREVERDLSPKQLAEKVKSVMKNTAECSESLCRYFPDLDADGQAATKHEKGPILSLIDDFPGIVTIAEESDSEDETGYVNCGPKKGPVHFVEPCPASFTTEQWTVLSQEDLPGITKLIGRPKQNPFRQLVLPFVVPAASLCSIKDAVLGRWLGKDLETYVICLRQLANQIYELHARGIVLCDFSAETIHVEKLSDDSRAMKIWVTSLSQIKVVPEGPIANELDRQVNLHCPQDPDQCRRAAPEVLQHGQYSTASDVYCFGMLVWWVFNAFDLSASGTMSNPGDLSPLNTVPKEKVYENVIESFRGPLLPRPECCPRHVFKLMQDSWQSQMHLRPSMHKMMRNLTMNENAEDAEGNDGYEEVGNIANASDTGSLSEWSPSNTLSSIATLSSIGNPSLRSDTDVDSVSSFGSDSSLVYNFRSPSLQSGDSEMEQEKTISFYDSDEELCTELGEESKGVDGKTMSRAKDGQHTNRPSERRDSLGLGGDENVYRNNPNPTGFLQPRPDLSEAQSDDDTYDELDKFALPESAPESGKEQPAQPSASAQPEAGGVNVNSPPPPPLPPRHPSLAKSLEDLSKLALPAPGVLIAETRSLSLDTRKIERMRQGIPPPLPARRSSTTEAPVADNKQVTGLSHIHRPLPPTPPVQRQMAFDSDRPPPLVPVTEPEVEYIHPPVGAATETVSGIHTERLQARAHSEAGMQQPTQALQADHTRSASARFTAEGVRSPKPVLLVKPNSHSQFVPEHSAAANDRQDAANMTRESRGGPTAVRPSPAVRGPLLPAAVNRSETEEEAADEEKRIVFV